MIETVTITQLETSENSH